MLSGPGSAKAATSSRMWKNREAHLNTLDPERWKLGEFFKKKPSKQLTGDGL